MGMVTSLAGLKRPDEYFLFINAEDRKRIDTALGSSVRVLALSGRMRAARLLFQQLLLPVAARRLRIDVIHSPAFIIPWYRGRAGHLLTVHDMSSFRLPRYHPGSRRGRLYEAAVRASIRRADLVSVPSESVRQDVLELVPDVSEKLVRVIACGVDKGFAPRSSDQVAPVLARLGVRWPYILYVGTLDPRKNLPRLIEAYAKLVDSGSIAEHLVLAGQSGWSVAELLDRLRLGSVRDRVHVLGYVREEDLPYLYAGARLFAYPSLLEGFGFPPLEAMASGVPVVASDSSSLRNNLAGAAVLVPPEDVSALAEAMRELLIDERIRTRHIIAGVQRAASFRWEAFAKATSDCYHQIGESKSRR